MDDNNQKFDGANNPNEDPQTEESNAARRLRMMGISTEAEKSDEPIVKAGFFENFWYHYKTVTIVTLIFAFIIGVGVYQMVSKVTPDVYIMYSGPTYYDNTRPLMDAFESVMAEDYNGDGEKKVNILHTVRYTPEQIAILEAEAEAIGEDYEFDYHFNAQEYERFQNEIMVGESIICLMDPSLYYEVGGNEIFMSLEEALGYVPEEAADDYAIYFKELKFAKFYSIFEQMPEDTLLVIRRTTAMQKLKGKKAETAQKNHVDYFKSMIEFEYPEGYTE